MSLEIPKSGKDQKTEDLKLAIEHLSEMIEKIGPEYFNAIGLTRSPDSDFVKYADAIEKAKDALGPDEYAKRMETINKVRAKADELHKLVGEMLSDHDTIKSELESSEN